MSRSKIDYGIDLGTTNSAICRIESGEPTIKKSDTQKDTIPSCVSVNKKGTIRVGDSAFNQLQSDRARALTGSDASSSNVYIEFKRTMGTDKKYHSTHLAKDFSSEELSAEILKGLKSFISDESVEAAVITVPAMFTVNQKDATVRAAQEHAGFHYCELLQEPIAASIAYGVDSNQKDGYLLVFDFGGGTFDAALVRVSEGIMKVIDTEGDNHLGGKNLDIAIVDEILLPHLVEEFSINSIITDDSKRDILKNSLKVHAEYLKVEMSFKDVGHVLTDVGALPLEDEDGEELELDLEVSREALKDAIGPVFQKAIDLCKHLLERNKLSNSDLDTLLLVGGPTYSPVLRQMLEGQVCKPNVSVDPMTVVAKGAALYASTIDIPSDLKEKRKDTAKVQLEFGYEATTVELDEFVTVKLSQDNGIETDGLSVELVRGDGGWSSGKQPVDTSGEVIDVALVEGKSNIFHAHLYDKTGNKIGCEPESITIIQGAKVGSATLPFHIGVAIKDISSGHVVFREAKGLEKNQSLPAVGTAGGLRTQSEVRPGIKSDEIKIGIYQGDHAAEGTRAVHQRHVYDAVISGDELPKLLPAGSDVELTLRVDRSELIDLSVYFPLLDFTIEKSAPRETVQAEVDASYLESEINNALQTISMIEDDAGVIGSSDLTSIEQNLNDLKHQLDSASNDHDQKSQILTALRKSLIKLDQIQGEGEWPRIKKELEQAFYDLEEAHGHFGTNESQSLFDEIKSHVPLVIKEKNVKAAQELIDNMRSFSYALADEGLGVQMEIGHLQYINNEFDTFDWKDSNRARQLINQGLQMAAQNPVKEQLRQLIRELYKLLPEADQQIAGSRGGSELIG